MTAPTIGTPDPDVSAALQLLAVGTLVELFELDLTPIVSGQPLIRFTNQAHPDGAMLRHDGNAYVPVPVSVEGYDTGGDRAVPQPLLRVSNVASLLVPILSETQGLRGALLTRSVLLSEWLDDGDTPEPTWYLRRDRHRIEQLASSNPSWLEFRLAAVVDLGDEQTPRRQVLRDLCRAKYRVWDGVAFDYTGVTCPYVAAAYWTAENVPTVNEDEDICSKHATACNLRFAGLPKPFWGFPGSGAGR
jgi:lambda family phage minor tail protein L